MESYRRDQGPGAERVHVALRGLHLLDHPMYNKSTAFTREERSVFGLEGLLPAVVSSMEQQSRRAYANIARKTDPLERYIGLAALQDRNEHLFYRVLTDHIEELLPIVYTPTVGRACQQFSHIFRRARGLWITPAHRGGIHQVLGNAPFDDVRLIVVTDNERILGLGDQGAGGMPIPIGKLALYTAAAGVPPWRTLPISLDVGTDNEALLGDELYLGWRQRRLRGEEYDSLVEEFVRAVKGRFPRALLQWEDFKKANAFRLLDRYRGTLPSFNDDIQGTAAVALAAVLAACRVTGSAFARQRIVILGGGAAGIGIGRLLNSALAEAGLVGDDLTRAIAVVDVEGLLLEGSEGDEYRRGLTWPRDLAGRHGLGDDRPRDLLAVLRALEPTVLIGISGAPGTFTESVIRELTRHAERPLVLPLSNPTGQAEARPEDVIRWSEGRALVATGSPFEPVSYGGRTIRISQANNAFVFPGIGLGALVAEASEVTEGMFAAAARSLAQEARAGELDTRGLFPPIAELARVTTRIAEAVVREAREAGVGLPLADDSIPEAVRAAIWRPEYPTLVV